MQLEKKERHNKKHGIWHKELVSSDIVLLYNTKREKNISRKLTFKWLGPYKITNVVKDKNTYILEELDGLQLARIFTNNKLKKFHPWQQL